jgi:ABC-type uncharacterized transport system permease subunit
VDVDAGGPCGALMQTEASVSNEIITVIQAMIVIFVAAPQLVREIFRLRAAKAVTAAATTPVATTAGTTANGGQA